MRKLRYLLAASALVLACTVANAQFSIGVKGGMSASWIKGTLIYDYENVIPHTGFYAGAVADYTFANDFMIQAELLYAGKGHTDNSELRGKFVRNLNYIQVPVFAGVKLAGESLSIMAGPEFGFLVNSTTKEHNIKYDSTDDCKPFNFAIAAQFNYMITDSFGIDVKFDWGLNRTFKSSTLVEGIQDKGKNMSLQLGIVYKFQLN